MSKHHNNVAGKKYPVLTSEELELGQERLAALRERNRFIDGTYHNDKYRNRIYKDRLNRAYLRANVSRVPRLANQIKRKIAKLFKRRRQTQFNLQLAKYNLSVN